MHRILTSLDNFPSELRAGALSVGNFDGVHRGHARLVGELVSLAARVGGPAIVMTFDPHPAALLHPDRKLDPPLTTIERRGQLLFDLGVDALIAYPTDKRLLSLSPEDFFQRLLLQRIGVRALVEGPNFRFGHQRAGDVVRLASLCESAEIAFCVVPATEDELGMVSSTRVRGLLLDGQLRQANALLTQPYRLRGAVVAGAGRGRQLGFPTANLARIDCLIPAWGVYAGRVELEGRQWAAAINIGPNPTFDEQSAKVEVHLITYTGPALYGRRLEVTMVDKIRDVRKFDSAEALRAQVARDLSECLSLSCSE